MGGVSIPAHHGLVAHHGINHRLFGGFNNRIENRIDGIIAQEGGVAELCPAAFVSLFIRR